MGIPEIMGRHLRKPTGWVGRVVAWLMTRETRHVFAWTVDQLELEPTSRVVELGFGRGESLGLLAERCPEGHVAGVEISQTMLDVVRGDYEALVDAGRIGLHRGDGKRLPLDDGAFDRALTINTLYITEDPAAQFAELFRVLAPGGLAVVCFPEREAMSARPAAHTEGFFLHELAAVEEAFRAAGFVDCDTRRKADLPLPACCLVGRKPAG